MPKTPVIMAWLMAAFLPACELVPSIDGRENLVDPDRVACQQFVFDSLMGNGLLPTPMTARAVARHDYLPPDTNLFGRRQHRFILELHSQVPNGRGVDAVFFHGGGGDVGMAVNDKEEVTRLLSLGYNVWMIEYRRGWHAGSYYPCIPRDPFSATAADLERMPDAANMALGDAQAAMAFIAELTPNQFLLYGTSFGASLALGCGPYASADFPTRERVRGVAACYGGMLLEAPVRYPMPTFFWYGLNDQINGPDESFLYQIEGPSAIALKGGRTMFSELTDAAPTWLVTHPFGHGYGTAEAIDVVDVAIASLMDTVLPVGSYSMVGGVLEPNFEGP